MKRCFSPARRGFTLIELMITVAVLVVLLGVVAPSMRSFISAQHVKGTAYDLTADLLLARSEALKRGTAVVVEPVSSGKWANGWCAHTGATCTSATEIRQHSAPNSTVSLDDSAPSSITFGSNGHVTNAAAVRLTIKSTVASSNTFRCIQVDLSGRARSMMGACS